MRLDNWLAQRAETCPERVALITPSETLAYAELEDRARAIARALAARGVRAGTAVALELGADPSYAATLHALMKLGAIAVPLNTRLSDHERAAVLADSEAMLTISGAAEIEGPEADLPLLGEQDLERLHCRILTSGTSGRPQLVGLTYGNHLWSAVGSGFNLGVDPDDRWLCCLPLYHVSGLSILVRSAIYGTGAVLHDGFEVDRVARSLREDGVTLVSLVATQLRRLLAEEVDISGPRAILVGGGPVPTDVLVEASERGATVIQTYGLTEAASQVTTLAPADAERKRGSAGRPLLTTHLRIEGGEILVQGPTVAPGFADQGGWLHTGDEGWIDPEGFVYVTGRRGDVIVTGGENVMPTEVEEVLLRHPAVVDCAVVGRPDSEWQEAVVAVVVPRNGAAPRADTLREHCAAELAGYKIPRAFEFAAELPRTPAGKLVRRELR